MSKPESWYNAYAEPDPRRLKLFWDNILSCYLERKAGHRKANEQIHWPAVDKYIATLCIITEVQKETLRQIVYDFRYSDDSGAVCWKKAENWIEKLRAQLLAWEKAKYQMTLTYRS